MLDTSIYDLHQAYSSLATQARARKYNSMTFHLRYAKTKLEDFLLKVVLLSLAYLGVLSLCLCHTLFPTPFPRILSYFVIMPMLALQVSTVLKMHA